MGIGGLKKGPRLFNVSHLVFPLIFALILALTGVAAIAKPVQSHDVPANQTVNAVACQNFSSQLSPSGAGNIWSTTGALPTWLTLSSTGIVSGNPPVALTGTTYTFTAKCTDKNSILLHWQFCSVTVYIAPCPALSYAPNYIPSAEENVSYYATLSATGGSGTYTWTANGLPSGLIIDNSGNISGTPPVGTANSYNITVSTTDTCSGQTINGSFVLVVAPGSYKMTVSIGSGLSGYKATVYIDEKEMGQIAGGESRDFKAQLGNSHTVRVQDTVEGPNQTRFVAKMNQKSVSESNPLADFDYTTAVNITVDSSPTGIAGLTGSGWYAVGELLTVSATGIVDDINNPGVQYRFTGWTLSNGETMGIANLSITVSASGTFTANYDTYYLLSLKSSDPMVDTTSWHAAGSTAEYSIDQNEVPMSSIWGFLGGFKKAVNPQGTHAMNGPYTVDITWTDNYTTPIIIITVITLLVIGLVLFFIWRRKRSKGGQPASTTLSEKSLPSQERVTSTTSISDVENIPTRATTASVTGTQPALNEKTGSSKEAEPMVQTRPATGSKFCPNCGDPIKAGEKFCDKCGNKLEEKERPLNCPKCGDPVAKDEKYCDKCGEKF